MHRLARLALPAARLIERCGYNDLILIGFGVLHHSSETFARLGIRRSLDILVKYFIETHCFSERYILDGLCDTIVKLGPNEMMCFN